MCVDSGVREMKSQKRLFAEELVGMFESGAGLNEWHHIRKLEGIADEENRQVVSH